MRGVNGSGPSGPNRAPRCPVQQPEQDEPAARNAAIDRADEGTDSAPVAMADEPEDAVECRCPKGADASTATDEVDPAAPGPAGLAAVNALTSGDGDWDELGLALELR